MMLRFARVAPWLTALAFAQSSHDPLHPPSRKFTLKDFESRLTGGPRAPSSALPIDQVTKLAENLSNNPEQFGTLLDLAGKMLKTIPPEMLPKNLDDVDPKLKDLARKLAENPQIRDRVLSNPELRDMARRMGKRLPPRNAVPPDGPAGKRQPVDDGEDALKGRLPGDQPGAPKSGAGPRTRDRDEAPNDPRSPARGGVSGNTVGSLRDMVDLSGELFGRGSSRSGRGSAPWPNEDPGERNPGSRSGDNPGGDAAGSAVGRSGGSGRRQSGGLGGNPGRRPGEPGANNPNSNAPGAGDPATSSANGAGAAGTSGAASKAGRSVSQREAAQQVAKTGRMVQEQLPMLGGLNRLISRATGSNNRPQRDQDASDTASSTRWISNASSRIGGAVGWLRQTGADSGLLPQGNWFGSLGGGAAGWLRHRLPSGGLRLNGGSMPNLGGLTAALRRGPSESTDEWLGSGRSAGSGLVIAVLLGLAVALVFGFRWTGTAARGTLAASGWKLAPAPAVKEPKERVRWMVEQATLGLLGGDSASQHHHDWRHRLGSELAAGPAGEELADLYERARYTPPSESLSEESVSRAEAVIKQLRATRV
jgi:hypothetical protein